MVNRYYIAVAYSTLHICVHGIPVELIERLQGCHIKCLRKLSSSINFREQLQPYKLHHQPVCSQRAFQRRSHGGSRSLSNDISADTTGSRNHYHYHGYYHSIC